MGDATNFCFTVKEKAGVLSLKLARKIWETIFALDFACLSKVASSLGDFGGAVMGVLRDA